MQVGVDAKMRWTLVVCAILAVWISVPVSALRGYSGDELILIAKLQGVINCADHSQNYGIWHCLRESGFAEIKRDAPTPDPSNPVFDAESARRLAILMNAMDIIIGTQTHEQARILLMKLIYPQDDEKTDL
jgi:hypothetical protein